MNAFRPWIDALGASARPTLGWLLAVVSLQWTALFIAIVVARHLSPAVAETSQHEATLLKVTPAPVAPAPITPAPPASAESAGKPSPRTPPSPPAPAAPTTTFRAALHLGDRWLVLHHVMANESMRPPTPTEAVLLTGGQVLLLHDAGSPAHERYTLVDGQSSCQTRAVRRVVIALDSGDPGPGSALGPRWVADQVSACELSAAAASVVALSGAPEVKLTRRTVPLPQRVTHAPLAEESCDINAYDHLFGFEIGSAHYDVLRAADDPDGLLVRRDDPGTSVAVLDARASLYWDAAGLDC